MKHSTYSFLPARRTALASAVILLLGASNALAQTSPSTGTTSRDARDTTPTTGANADVNATREVNARTGAGAPTGRDTATSKLSWGDRRFVTKAADGGHDEISLAQLAAQRASNPEVRTFAQKLVNDHQQVSSELTQIAGQKNVKLDKDDDHSRAYKRLSKKTGAEFDQEFVEHMVDDHERDVKMFEKAASDAKDPEIRSFAAKHVEHLRQHLQQAQSLRQTVMPTGRMDSSSGRSTTGADTVPSTTPATSTPSSTDTSTTPRRDGTR